MHRTIFIYLLGIFLFLLIFLPIKYIFKLKNDKEVQKISCIDLIAQFKLYQNKEIGIGLLKNMKKKANIEIIKKKLIDNNCKKN